MNFKIIRLAVLPLFAILLGGCAGLPSSEAGLSQNQHSDPERIKVFIYPKVGRVIDGTYVQIDIAKPAG